MSAEPDVPVPDGAYPDVTALITGGASGIGAATAARLRAARVRVVTADLAPGTDEKLDVTDPAAVDALRDAPGPVGILVNNAGVVGPSRPLVDVGLDEWRATFRVNVDGTVLLCRAIAPGGRRRSRSWWGDCARRPSASRPERCTTSAEVGRRTESGARRRTTPRG
jgi:2-dehydro-3-deoxy-L-rhamnonate dehydrogenase (NAD+)